MNKEQISKDIDIILEWIDEQYWRFETPIWVDFGSKKKQEIKDYIYNLVNPSK